MREFARNMLPKLCRNEAGNEFLIGTLFSGTFFLFFLQYLIQQWNCIKSLFKYLLNGISLALSITITAIYHLSHSIFPYKLHIYFSNHHATTIPPSHQFSFYFPIINILLNIQESNFAAKSNPLSTSSTSLLYRATTTNDFPCDPIFFPTSTSPSYMWAKITKQRLKKKGSIFTHATHIYSHIQSLNHHRHRKFHVPGDDTINVYILLINVLIFYRLSPILVQFASYLLFKTLVVHCGSVFLFYTREKRSFFQQRSISFDGSMMRQNRIK